MGMHDCSPASTSPSRRFHRCSAVRHGHTSVDAYHLHTYIPHLRRYYHHTIVSCCTSCLHVSLLMYVVMCPRALFASRAAFVRMYPPEGGSNCGNVVGKGVLVPKVPIVA